MKIQKLIAFAIVMGLSFQAGAQDKAIASDGGARYKAIAEAGVAKIHNFYQNSIKRLSMSGAQMQDIEMACMGEVFLEWFDVYSGVIERTDGLHFSEVNGYREAEQKAHLVENDRKIYESMRPDVTAKILGEMTERRAQTTWPVGPDGVTLEDPKDQVLLANFTQCRDEAFVAAIRGAYETNPGFENQNISVEISAYVPHFKTGEPPYKVPPMYGAVEDGLSTYTNSYENWLYDIQTR